MILTGFIGYVLPWGQMSLWGATVITNLVSAVPFIGSKIVGWIWSGFCVGNATLIKFFGLHFTLPFVLCGIAGYHLSVLHITGSSNKLGIECDDKIDFTPYCIVKDSLVFVINIIFFGILVNFLPNMLGHPDNYVLATALTTPSHILPEWYFLPFYAILRAIDHKLLGVMLMLGSIVGLMLLPFCHRSGFRSSVNRDLYKFLSVFFIITVCILTFLGQCDIVYPFSNMGTIFAIYYFGFIFLAEQFEVKVV
jgi:ubiquinol-cytochrome c reductase cytochrome b subunit